MPTVDAASTNATNSHHSTVSTARERKADDRRTRRRGQANGRQLGLDGGVDLPGPLGKVCLFAVADALCVVSIICFCHSCFVFCPRSLLTPAAWRTSCRLAGQLTCHGWKVALSARRCGGRGAPKPGSGCAASAAATSAPRASWASWRWSAAAGERSAAAATAATRSFMGVV